MILFICSVCLFIIYWSLRGILGARYSCSASGSWSTFASCVSSGVPQRFSNHPSKAFDMLAHMWRNKHLCDVILGVAGTEVEIECHRNVLASSSPYFYAMFRNDLAESHSNRIMLHVSIQFVIFSFRFKCSFWPHCKFYPLILKVIYFDHRFQQCSCVCKIQ